jgi:hypothetical protein
LFWTNQHPPPPPPSPPLEREQLADGGLDQIQKVAVAEDADKVEVAAAAVSSSIPFHAKPYHSGSSDDDDNEARRWEEGAAARRLWYLEVAGYDKHPFGRDSMGMDPGSSYDASVDGTLGRYVCVTSQDVRLEIERTQKCALHSCIENLGNFRAFNKTCQSD